MADREFRVAFEVDLDAFGNRVVPDLPVDFARWLDGRTRFGVQPGLERMQHLMAASGLSRARVPTILVGGTNGKGTVAAALADALARAGYRPGLYMSPHVERFLERIQVSGSEPDRASLAAACEETKRLVEALDAEGQHATYFESATLLALLVFRAHQANPLVLEVGLGGRLDAVNAMEPAFSVITNVTRDHEHVLGHTLEQRCTEKAGIMRAGTLCFTAATGPALGFLKREAAARGATLVPVQLALSSDAPSELAPDEANLTLVRAILGHAEVRRRLRNLARMDALSARLPHLPGRRETFLGPDGKTILIDGAHNEQALRHLKADLEDRVFGPSVQGGPTGAPRTRAVLLFGQLADRETDVGAPLAQLGFASRLITRPPGGRSCDPTTVAAEWTGRGVPAPETHDSFEDAWAAAWDATPPDGTLVVAGSFYLAGAARAQLRRVNVRVP